MKGRATNIDVEKGVNEKGVNIRKHEKSILEKTIKSQLK